MIDLVFYAVVEVLTGLAPSYASFLVLRALFGIGMGGEWGVGASLVMEKVGCRRCAAPSSGLLQQGYAAGYLLAAVAYFVVFPRLGWRPLFFLGGLPALLALFIRARVTESDAWRRARMPDWRCLRRRDRGQLADLPHHHAPDGDDEHDLARHPGPLPHLPGAELGARRPGPRAGDGRVDDRGARRGVLVGRWSDRIGRRRAIGSARWRARC